LILRALLLNHACNRFLSHEIRHSIVLQDILLHLETEIPSFSFLHIRFIKGDLFNIIHNIALLSLCVSSGTILVFHRFTMFILGLLRDLQLPLYRMERIFFIIFVKTGRLLRQAARTNTLWWSLKQALALHDLNDIMMI
jgi:hypothetical protein